MYTCIYVYIHIYIHRAAALSPSASRAGRRRQLVNSIRIAVNII